MEKQEISKQEYGETIDEILHCRELLTKTFDKYTTNTIDRLIVARIKIEFSTVKEEKPVIHSIATK